MLVAGELGPSGPGRPDEFVQGAAGTIEVSGGTTARVALKPGERTFLTTVTLASAPAGDVDVRARITATGGSLPVTANIRIRPGGSADAILFRRGPSTGNRLVPAPTFAVSRTERVRVEVRPAAPAAGREVLLERDVRRGRALLGRRRRLQLVGHARGVLGHLRRQLQVESVASNRKRGSAKEGLETPSFALLRVLFSPPFLPSSKQMAPM